MPPPWFGTGDDGPKFARELLVRPAQGRYIAGVCAALGRATNTDPVLWRVVLVVLGLFGGVGVLIYLIGWLGIRAENDAVSPIESLFGRGKSATAPLSVALLAVATVLTFVFVLHDGFRATLLIAAIAAGIFLLMRRNTTFPFGSSGPRPATATAAGPAPDTAPPVATPMAEPTTAQFTAPPATDYRPPFAPHGPYAQTQPPAPPQPPRPPKPKRERSKLGRITFFAVLMVLGVLAMIDVAGASVPVSGYLAAALATVALGLIVGAWFGRARGLIALAIIVSIGLGVATVAERYGNQLVNSNYHPANVSQIADRYDFTAGDVTLDLRQVDFTGAVQDTTVKMKLGQVRVLLPPTVDTSAVVTMQNGTATVFASDYDGQAVHSITATDQGADGAGGGTLRLTLQVDNGNVEVAR